MRVAPLVEPYRLLAARYDDTLGGPHLAILAPRFERLVRELDLRFRRAADLGCGTGLFTEHLCRRFGVPVIGVDRSRQMLARAAARVAGLPVLLLQQDLRRLRLPHPVDLVTMTFDTLNYLVQPGDVCRLFARVRERLRPRGHLVFDSLTPAQPIGPRLRFERTFRHGADETTQRIVWDPRARLLHGVVVRRRAGRPIGLERHVERTYHLREIARFLRSAGLEVRSMRDAATLARATPRAPRVLVVAQRPSR